MSLDESNAVAELERLIEPNILDSSVLCSAPASSQRLEQIGLPEERHSKFIALARTLISDGVTKPDKLAEFLDEVRPDHSLRKYSEALWDMLGIADKSLRGTHNWQAIYAKLDKAKVGPVGRPRRNKNSKPPKPDTPKDSTPAPQDSKAAAIKEAIATMPPMWQEALNLSMKGTAPEDIATRMNLSETAVGNILRTAQGRLRILLEAGEGKLKLTEQVEAKNLSAETPIQTNFTSLISTKPAVKTKEKIEAVRTEVRSVPPTESAYVAKAGFEPSASESREIERVLGLADATTQIVVQAIVSGDSCVEAAERAGISPEKAAFCYIEFSDVLPVRIRNFNYHKRRRIALTTQLPPLMERVILDRYFTAKDCDSFLREILVPSLAASLSFQGEARKPDQHELNMVIYAAQQYRSLPSEFCPPSNWSGCVWTAGAALLGLVLAPIGIGFVILIGAVIGQVVWSDKQANKWKEECEQAKQKFRNGPQFTKAVQVAGCVIAHENHLTDRKRRYRRHWAEMDWRALEIEVAKLFSKMGFKAEATPPSNDGGVDVVALKNSVKTVIQCKQHENVIGSPDVVQLIGTAKIQKADVAIMYSKSGFTSGARETARNAGVILWTLDDLVAHARKVYGT